jgi:hypothetical protein
MAASYCVAELVFVAFVGTEHRDGRFKAVVDPEQSAILETSSVPLLLKEIVDNLISLPFYINRIKNYTGKFEVPTALTVKSNCLRDERY